MLSRRNVRKGEGSVGAHLACHHRHDHVRAGAGPQNHHRAGCGLALRVAHRARDACHSRGRQRDVQRQLLTESEGQRLRVGNVDRPGIERGCEALARVGRAARTQCHAHAHLPYDRADDVLAWHEPVQPKLAKVVGQDERLTAAEGEPALAARPVLITLRLHLRHRDRLTEFVGNATRDDAAAGKRDVNVAQRLVVAERDGITRLERPALTGLERHVTALRGGDGVAAGRQLREVVTAIRVGRRHPPHRRFR